MTIDILVELSVPSRIALLTYEYPWRIVRGTMDIGHPRRFIWVSMDIVTDIHTNTGARTVRYGLPKGILPDPT